MENFFTQNKKKIIIALSILIVLIIAIGAYIFWTSQENTTHVEKTDQTGISVNVACEGWNAETSTPIALAIYKGDVKETLLSTDENIEIPEPLKELSLKANEDTKIENIVDAGTYTLSIVGSPVLEDGTIFEVPEPKVIEYDGEKGQLVKFELVKKDASEITEADLAAATAAASAVGADATNAVNNSRNAASSAQGGSIQQGQGNAQSKPSGGNSSNSDNNGGNSGGNAGNSGSGGSSHTHSWVEQTKTINHPAEYDTIHHPAVTQSYYVCNGCGAKFSDSGSVGSHIRQGIIDGSGCQSYSTRQETIQAAYDEQVLVKDAWTETVVTGYKCSGCGATK